MTAVAGLETGQTAGLGGDLLSPSWGGSQEPCRSQSRGNGAWSTALASPGTDAQRRLPYPWIGRLFGRTLVFVEMLGRIRRVGISPAIGPMHGIEFKMRLRPVRTSVLEVYEVFATVLKMMLQSGGSVANCPGRKQTPDVV